MKVTWLGQASLLFEDGSNCVLVDPYFSDSCAQLSPKLARRVPVDPAFFDIRPTVIFISHDHLDHLDPDTLKHFLSSDTPITVLAPYQAWEKVRKFGGVHNYVLFDAGTVWSEGGLTFYSVKAKHSDLTAAGIIIDNGDKTYYVTGDTLYHFGVIEEVLALCPEGVDAVFVPVNGVGNNMNMQDAADFAIEIEAKAAVPIHFGLFDALDPAKDFPHDGKVIPEYGKEIPL